MKKQSQFIIQGMNRDLSESVYNSKYAYENRNIRITPTNNNTMFSITNEKGNSKIPMDTGEGYFYGTPIGYSVLNNNLIVFSTVNDLNQYIYKYTYNNDNSWSSQILFSGNLGMSNVNSFDSIAIYENDDIQKVYWTDNVNPLRFINIKATTAQIDNWNKDSFNFVPKLKLKEVVNISRNIVSGGEFAPGTIQYSFTYFNKYGSESNVFHTSPLYYISYNNRGANAEDKVGNSFSINLSGLDTSFDYVRIYSIHRTSIDATPTVLKVVDIAINSNGYAYFVDNGITGTSIDPTDLLYVGGEEITSKTLEQKDNTLFLGNITLKRKIINSSIKTFFNNCSGISTTAMSRDSIDTPDATGYYPYKSNLLYNSYSIKGFKHYETYRFGVQFQHYTGKWSEPIWMNDVRIQAYPEASYTYKSTLQLPTAYYKLSDSTIISQLISDGYYKMRPVVVYPSLAERECICQGILCPTVYNVSDRYSNSPFVQSSWFARPNAPFDYTNATTSTENSAVTATGDWKGRPETSSDDSYNSKAGTFSNGKIVHDFRQSGNSYDYTSYGRWLEFRNNYPIPNNDSMCSEIQSIYNALDTPAILPTVESTIVTSHSNNFFVDSSIVTFHSPDIEFNTDIRSIDTSSLKLRIVGIVPITSFVGDIDIQSSTLPNNYKIETGTETDKYSNDTAYGFYKQPVGIENISKFGFRTNASGMFWMDEISNPKSDYVNTYKSNIGFVVYPFNRNGSLNNTKYAKDGYKSATLKIKKLSNLKYSYNTRYLSAANIWYAYINGSTTHTGISGISVFDSNEVVVTKLPSPVNSGLNDIIYYGNVNKILTTPIIEQTDSNNNGYPIVISNGSALPEYVYNSDYTLLSSKNYTDDHHSTDPVSMKYKSTAHAVLALNYSTDHKERILPTLMEGDSYSSDVYRSTNNVSSTLNTINKFFWEPSKYCTGVSQDTIDESIDYQENNSGTGYGIDYGWLWLGELYNDSISSSSRFGGQTEEAFENNKWLAGGEAVNLLDSSGTAVTSATMYWTEGDTYYQRYDNLKTYPFTTEDQNQIVDIVSFMCETRINLDGRYDKNRGLLSNINISPTNFNLMNNVYSQENNFYTYNTINSNKINPDVFKNTITWTKTKTTGELIDNWTNITLASTLDLDGNKGYITSLNKLNNNLLAFQDKGISQILYNENVQVSSTNGLPIEIANSGKVQGKRYLSDKIGCKYLYSICNTPKGIYFSDSNSKNLYLFDGQFTNISDKCGFHSWLNTADNSNLRTFYDKINNDLLLFSPSDCLAYSESIDGFTSFYDYGINDTSNLMYASVQDKGVFIRHDTVNTSFGYIWEMNAGNYNYFYDVYKPFSTTVIANQDPTNDKIFDNLEFRADSWDASGNLLNTTFDTLNTWNEYQNGVSTLTNTLDKPSTLKKKFRVWRANIPRDSVYTRDRMRNPWLYLKLSMNTANTNKTELHDMVINYFE